MNRDFNFFSPYIEVKRTNKAHRLYLLLSGGLLFVVFAGFIIWNLYTINSLRADISEKEKFLDSPQVKKSLMEYEELRARIDELGKYYKGISLIHDEINRRDFVKSSILDNIAKAIPSQVFLQNVAADVTGVSLVCTSSNIEAVAAFERNLKQAGNFETVNVASTKKQDNYYTSTIKIKIKEVADIEAD
jgi:Tfp pilus assembly protein PilN